MAKSTSGNWVSRVGAAGGGKTYKKARPANFYGALVLIVVVGLLLVVYSRYEYQNPAKHASTSAPKVGSILYAGIAVQACGKSLPFLPSDPKATGGFQVGPADVIRLSPVGSEDAGKNATLKQFGAEYDGLVVTSSELAIPNAKGAADAKTTYVNGATCPSTSKYPGKTANVIYAYWSSLGQKKPTTTTDPALIHFSKNLRVTMAFEPAGVTPKAPSKATVNEMFLASTTPTTTTSTATATTSTTTTTLAKTTTTTKG